MRIDAIRVAFGGMGNMAGFVLALLTLALPAQAGVQIQSWQASTGARVLFVENHDLPILDVSVDFPAGSSADTPEKSGLASMTNHLLGLGAEGMGEDAISRAFADIGAVFSGRFATDRAGVSLRTLSSDQEKRRALETFSRVLQKPAFPDAVLERERARTIAANKESAPNRRPSPIAPSRSCSTAATRTACAAAASRKGGYPGGQQGFRETPHEGVQDSHRVLPDLLPGG